MIESISNDEKTRLQEIFWYGASVRSTMLEISPSRPIFVLPSYYTSHVIDFAHNSKHSEIVENAITAYRRVLYVYAYSL